MTAQPVLTVSNLTKFYGDFKTLNSVSFSVNKGWIYGYLGPNGAGYDRPPSKYLNRIIDRGKSLYL